MDNTQKKKHQISRGRKKHSNQTQTKLKAKVRNKLGESIFENGLFFCGPIEGYARVVLHGESRTWSLRSRRWHHVRGFLMVPRWVRHPRRNDKPPFLQTPQVSSFSPKGYRNWRLLPANYRDTLNTMNKIEKGEKINPKSKSKREREREREREVKAIDVIVKEGNGRER